MWTRLFNRDQRHEDLDEEIRAHVALATRDRVERGESPQEAERSVRLELGNELLIREVTGDMWGWAGVDKTTRDLKYALRQMKRSPGFTAIAVLTLALGLGATTAMFSIVNGVLLEPLKYRDPDRLFLAQNIPSPGMKSNGNWPVDARQFGAWRSGCRSCEEVALVEGMGSTLTGVGEPERLPGLRVSYNFFRTLGVEPAQGRDFLPEEELPERANEILIADSLWRGRFASDPNIVGRAVQINGESVTVVGVMPQDLSLPVGNQWGVLFASRLPPVIFRPLGIDFARLHGVLTNNYVPVIRLKAGVRPQQAVAEMNSLVVAIASQLDMVPAAALVPMQDTVTRGARRGLWLLLGAVGAVLLIVCVNVGNLMLVRTASRDREAGIRMALGASRGESFGLVLKEGAMLAAAGAGLGVLLACAALKVFTATAPVNLPRAGEVHMDARALLFAIAATALSTVICGVIPAWRLSGTEPQESLKLGASSATAHRTKLRFRELMVSAEVALSTVLLIVGSLLMFSFVRLIRVEKGFEVAHVITQDISLLNAKYSDPLAAGKDPADQNAVGRTRFIDAALRGLATIPGVDSVGVTNQVPLRGETWLDELSDADRPPSKDAIPPLANYRFVSPGYWSAIGIPLKRGRLFEESDRTRKVAVLSERAAQLLWPGEDAIGKHLHLTADVDGAGEVIGVVGEARATLEQEAPLTVYEPHWVRPIGAPSFVIRTRLEPNGVMGSVRAALRSMDPELPIAETKTMEQVLSESVAVRRFQMYLAAAFAAAALALASLGIYGVISFTVARRAAELGIRIALGARAGELMAMVVGQGMLYVAAGLTAGIGGALAIGRFLSSELYGVTPHDPAIIAGVAMTLLAVSAFACWIPARRAARIDPVRALRVE